MKRKPLCYLPSGDLGPIQKGDYIETNSFSRNHIREEELVFVPSEHQMVVFGGLKGDGEIKLDGEICLL